jgi:hypothetical protein
MSEHPERLCVGCGDSGDVARFDACGICGRLFCADCAHRAAGRRFCSAHCAHVHYFGGDDDDQDLQPDD